MRILTSQIPRYLGMLYLLLARGRFGNALQNIVHVRPDQRERLNGWTDKVSCFILDTLYFSPASIASLHTSIIQYRPNSSESFTRMKRLSTYPVSE